MAGGQLVEGLLRNAHRNMKPCSEMLLEVTVYCGKVRDQRGCLKPQFIAVKYVTNADA